MLCLRESLIATTLALVATLAVPTAASAAETIQVALGTNDFDGSRVAPGTVVVVQPGERSYLRLSNLSGTTERPIVVVNGGGLVRLANTDRGYALVLSHCNDVRLTGTGAATIPYGFSVETKKKGMFAVHVNDRSTRIEVDHVEVTGAGFAGFNVKDEPRADGSTNRGNWVMEDIHLHHNYVHDVEGEGFYVGHTFYDGIAAKGSATKLLPHVIKGLQIDHNRCENTGCEGIQVGSTISGLVITDNVIINPGQRPFADYQNNGMQINAAGDALIARNIVIGAPGNGIISFGLEDDYAPTFAYNLVARSGSSGLVVGGDGGKSGSGARFLHNTLAANGGDGIHFSAKFMSAAIFVNNFVVANRNQGIANVYRIAAFQESGTIAIKDLAAARFRDPTQDSYDIGAGSPAIGRGVAIPNAPFAVDLAGRDLSKARAVDVGAYAPSAPDMVSKDVSTKKERQRPTPKANVRPELPADWLTTVSNRLEKALTAKQRIRFHSTALNQEMDVTDFDRKDLTIEGGGLSMSLRFDRLTADDGASLAAGLADLVPNDDEWRSFTATMLEAVGRGDDAKRYQR